MIKNITGYIRLANEEHTILPCLDSIKNIFDKILILHSNITDSSLELINRYINQNNITNIEIQKYPYDVIPYLSVEYATNSYKHQNSLAAYHNFGLQFIETDFLMKIDADQIYINSKLKDYVNTIANDKSQKIFCMTGHNCIVSRNRIYLDKNRPINGGTDHFCVPVKNIYFVQEKRWELIKFKEFKPKFHVPKTTFWFHLQDGRRFDGTFTSGDDCDPNSLQCFDETLIPIYEKYILPLLQKFDSKYQYLKYK
jgi:hypothetical protein